MTVPVPPSVSPTSPDGAATLHVTKGHGTRNDFVLVADPQGTFPLDAATARELADRHGGLGGDGVIRVVPSADLPEGTALLAEDAAARWFMDYRNADGSLAQMCGNGVRVFAAFVERLGLHDFTAGPLAVGTRAGVKHVVREAPGWFAVDMGAGRVVGGSEAVRAGADAHVEVPGLGGPARPGLSVDMGNPHTVVALASLDELAAVDLAHAPVVTPTPPEGTNVELVVPLGEVETPEGIVGHVRMRVHERGVGETQSCGTGACAAAIAVRAWAGEDAPTTWLVDVPGGQVRVRLLADEHVELAGPAVLVAEADVDLTALAPR